MNDKIRNEVLTKLAKPMKARSLLKRIREIATGSRYDKLVKQHGRLADVARRSLAEQGIHETGYKKVLNGLKARYHDVSMRTGDWDVSPADPKARRLMDMFNDDRNLLGRKDYVEISDQHKKVQSALDRYRKAVDPLKDRERRAVRAAEKARSAATAERRKVLGTRIGLAALTELAGAGAIYPLLDGKGGDE